MRAHLAGLIHAVLISGAASELAGHGAGTNTAAAAGDSSATTQAVSLPSATSATQSQSPPSTESESLHQQPPLPLQSDARTGMSQGGVLLWTTPNDPWDLMREVCWGDPNRRTLGATWTGPAPEADDIVNGSAPVIEEGGPEPSAPPLDHPPHDELPDGLESFEEWKRRHAVEDVPPAPPPPSPPALESEAAPETGGCNRSSDAEPCVGIGGSTDANTSGGDGSSSNSTAESSASGGNSGGSSSGTDNTGAAQPPPAKKGHRYNYASPDCSARVLASSPLTQHASSLLHKSRDRYMLTPCRADEHYVVVELCDEIRVEAIELAVWEFFSGVVRGVQVQVADESSGPWTLVGDFVGKNVRSVQTFTLPEPTSFHRFLRLDFGSYYGTEYYCPVSQLKVYGMNQMEAFKMEQRHFAEVSGAQDRERERERGREKEREEDRQQELLREAAAAAHEKERHEREDDEKRERELCELEKLVQAQARRSRDEITFEPLIECPAPTQPSSTSTSTRLPLPSGEGAAQVSSEHSAESVNDSSVVGSTVNTTATSGEAGNGSASSPYTYGSASSASYTRSSAPRAESSESIYAFIIRRLTALEGNSTLVARYIDEQAKAIRTALSRAEARWEASRSAAAQQDLSRWESERMRQEERLGRVFTQMESMRHLMEAERRLVEAQLRLLADELWFERRRNLAQLVILVVIIALGVFSRGSTIDALLRPLAAGDSRRQRREATTTTTTEGRHQKRLSTGPLAGLVIDVPPPLSPASSRASTPIAPHDRPEWDALLSPRAALLQAQSQSPSHHARVAGMGKALRRPITPNSHLHPHMRRRTPASRSFSAADPGALAFAGDMDDDGYQHMMTPSRPMQRRHLARSSHLHTIRRRGDESSEAEGAVNRRGVLSPSGTSSAGHTSASDYRVGGGLAPPFPPALRGGMAVFPSPSPRAVAAAAAVRAGRMAAPDDDSQWTEDGLSADSASVGSAGDDGEGSASEVEDGMSRPPPPRGSSVTPIVTSVGGVREKEKDRVVSLSPEAVTSPSVRFTAEEKEKERETPIVAPSPVRAASPEKRPSPASRSSSNGYPLP